MKNFLSVLPCFVSFAIVIICPTVGESFEQPLEEVFQTELVYPQEKGEVQLTLAPRLHKNESRKLYELPLEIEYGITNAWQVGAEWVAYQSLRPVSGDKASGIGDLELETKYSFMNIGGANTHAALGFGMGFPVGDVNEDLSEGFREYTPSVMLAHDFLQWNGLQLFTQAGLNYQSREKSRDDPEENEPQAHEFFWNTGFFVPWKNWRWTTEWSWQTNRWNHDGDEAVFYVTPGVVYRLAKDVELGIASAFGLNEDADDYVIIGQMVYEFDLFGESAK